MNRKPGEPIEIILKTLSPIHIGSGDIIESFDFILIKNVFYRLNTDECFKYIFNKNKTYIEEFNKWINEVTFETEQRAGYQKKERLKIFHFIEKYLNNHNLSNDLKNIIPNNQRYYHYKILSYSNPENKEIKECIKTPNYLVYIPGSSIKGVIRTALLNYIIARNHLNKTILKNVLSDSNNNKKYFGQDIENIPFKGKNERNNYDEKFDILKFIKISDTNAFKPEEVCRILTPKLYLQTKPPQPQVQPIEAIKENIEFKFYLTIDAKGILQVKKNLNNLNKDGQWKDFDNKFKNTFGFNLDSYNEKELEEKIINSIKEALSDFSSALINIEIDWNNKLNENNKKFNINSFLNTIPEGSIALKLGWASGFPGVTIYDALTQNEEIKRKYEEKLNILKIGREEIKLDKFPKSRRLEAKQNNIPGPLSWIELKFPEI